MILNRMLGSSKYLPQRQKREPCKGEFAWCWLIGITLCVLNPLAFDKALSDSNYKPTHYKQYILMTLNDLDQTYCLIDLYSKENSKWDPKTVNGSHVGIPQGRSTYLKKASGIQQINWGVRYIGNRYGWVDEVNKVPNACAAWDHFLKKGWH
jgi:hypothetical protein